MTTAPEHTGAWYAAVLGETEPEVIALLDRVLVHLGSERAQAFLQAALKQRDAGGMLTSDGTRQRTLGGMFFFLLKHQLYEEGEHTLLNTLFPAPPAPGISIPGRLRPRRPPPPATTPAALHARAAGALGGGRRPDQAALTAIVDRCLGTPHDLVRRSLNPDTGVVTLTFHFPAIAERRYAPALQAIRDAGVHVELAPHVYQPALVQVVQAVLPSGWTMTKTAIHEQMRSVVVHCIGEATVGELTHALTTFHTQTGWTLAVVGLLRQTVRDADDGDGAGFNA